MTTMRRAPSATAQYDAVRPGEAGVLVFGGERDIGVGAVRDLGG
jgi:hypothetical protein